jgi:hypothetical protein
VDELHINLPFEITEKRKELAALEDKVRTNEARAEKARIKAETDDDPGISTAVTSTPTSSRLAMNATFRASRSSFAISNVAPPQQLFKTRTVVESLWKDCL